MKTYHDYTELSRKIHAPEELKAKVLRSAAEGSGCREKAPAGRYSRGWSVLQKATAAAVAAVLAITIPIAGYAAVNGLGLKERLAKWGMQDVQALEELTNSQEEISGGATNVASESGGQEEAAGYSTQYAKYFVEEVILDSKTLYVKAKIMPLDDTYLLIPDIWMGENIIVDGVNMGTVEEYAASQGKTPVYAGIRFDNSETPINGGGYDYSLSADGSMYYYFSGENTFSSNEIALECTGLARTEGMNKADRVEFKVQLRDKSSVVASRIYTTFDTKALEETGIQINSLTLEETELGLYATFNYAANDAKFDGIFFKVMDASGKELEYLPGVGGAATGNEDGTFNCVLYYQKPATMDGLQFAIRDIGNDVNYGPYSFEK